MSDSETPTSHAKPGTADCACKWDGGLRSYCDEHNPCFSHLRNRRPMTDATPQATEALLAIGHSMADALAEHGKEGERLGREWQQACAALFDAEVKAAPVATRKPCTCLGTCRGANGLGPGWRCAMEPDSPSPRERHHD